VKVKKIKLGMKDVKQVSNGAGKNITVKKEKDEENDKKLCFESIKEFRKAITPKRIELLHITKTMNPKSINELARILERDIKSISTDIHLLGKLGLINFIRKTEGRKEVMPVVDYAKINLEIVV